MAQDRELRRLAARLIGLVERATGDAPAGRGAGSGAAPRTSASGPRRVGPPRRG